MRTTCLRLSLLVVLAACTGGDAEPEFADAGPDSGPYDAGPSYADGDWLFEPDRVLDIRIELPADEWDALRAQTRDVLDILGESCAEGPAPKAFTYRPATVTIEGETFSDVGVRKKGFLGSLSTTKPSLKLKMNEYVQGQNMNGLTRFTLNNAKQDPSYVNQCIGYDVFRAAGVPAPRCNFAHVRINGEPLGLFVHVESVKKPFLRTHFASDDGNLYEGTLSDFRSGWTETFEKKTNEADTSHPEVDEVAAALLLDGEPMVQSLGKLLDVDEFIRFWALETLLGHHDGYTGNSNNFYLYGSPDPTNRDITFMPWGIDNLFGDAPSGPKVALTRSLLPQKLFSYEPTREKYIAALREVLDETWEDSEVLAEIARIESLIRPHVSIEEETAFTDGLDRLRQRVTGREAAFRAALDEIAGFTPEPLMEPLCFDEIGSVATSFDTTWEGGGTATLSVMIDGSPLSLQQPTSVAVPSDDDPNGALVAIFADVADTGRVLLLLPVPQDVITPGTITVNSGILLFYPPGSEEFDRAVFAAGTLTFEEATTVTGEPVLGSAQLTLWNTPFL